MAKDIAASANVMSVPYVVKRYIENRWDDREVFDNFVVISKSELENLVFSLLKSGVGADDALDGVRDLIKRYGYDDTDHSLGPVELAYVKKTAKNNE